MKQNLKVLFFSAWYPNHINQLAGIFVREHAKALKPCVKDIAVFNVFPDGSLPQWIKFEVVTHDGITLYRILHKKFGGFLYGLNLILYPVATIIGYFKTYKIFGKADINHVHVLTRAAALPFILKKMFKTPYYITEHWTRYLVENNSYNGFFHKALTKFLVKNSDGLSTVSVDLKNAMGKHGLVHFNFKQLNNTINTDKFKLKIKQPNQRFVFLHVSGLVDKSKNVSDILRTLQRLKNRELSFEFRIVGDDKDKEMLEKLTVELDLFKYVKFYGKLYGDDLVSQFQQADAFVLFSNFENQPCVLLESFACGLPVISTKVGGIGEIVNRNNGILIKAKDTEALFHAMDGLISGEISFDRKTIAEEAYQKYSYEAVAKQMLEFYNGTSLKK